MRSGELHEFLRQDFIGLDTRYPVVGGRVVRRHYLDSAASTLMMDSAYRVTQAFLKHYANTHSQLHFSARVATEVYRWAHRRVLEFVVADPGQYTCFFSGSGATTGLNRLARTLAALRPHRDVVLVSAMEHHSNDLPHRKHAGKIEHVPLQGEGSALESLDLAALGTLLERNRNRVNYVAVSAASNVTGITNPLHDIAELAHAAGAWVVVDASQLLAHAPVQMTDPADCRRDLDFLVFSGHKAYAPGSPGVVVARRSLLAPMEPDELGGGMVESVYLDSYHVATDFPDREEAGTPNIIGALLLASVLELLGRVGMPRVHMAEQALLKQALRAMSAIPGVLLYGSTDLDRVPRTGTIAFNVDGLDHGLVAAALNDYHNIAVRNECFCAHPYVREMLKAQLWMLDIDPDAPGASDLIKLKQGMVRASFALYTTPEDVDALLAGIRDVIARQDELRALYLPGSGGNYHHCHFAVRSKSLFNPSAILDDVTGPSVVA